MSRAIRHAPRAFTSHDSGLSCCDVCHNSGARYSAKDGMTLCKQHRAERRLQLTTMKTALNDGGAGGSFTPASVELTASAPVVTVTYTPKP